MAGLADSQLACGSIDPAFAGTQAAGFQGLLRKSDSLAEDAFLGCFQIERQRR
jgi:hypothetical protein